MGMPKPSSTRPSSAGADRHRGGARRGNQRFAQLRPSVSSSGMERTLPLRKPMTWVRMRRPLDVIDFAEIADGDGGAAGFDHQADEFGYGSTGNERIKCQSTESRMAATVGKGRSS